MTSSETRRGGAKKDKDSGPRDKVLQLYLYLVLAPGRHFKKDLAERFNFAETTTSNIIDVIERHIGRTAELKRGKHKNRTYYELVMPTTAETLGVSLEEVRYLALCRDLAEPFLPPETHARLGRSLRELATSLNGTAQLPHKSIGFRTKGTIDYTPHLPNLQVLRTAIEKKEICTLLYRALGRKEERQYRFAPGVIIALNGALYVQGYRLEDGSVLAERPSTFLLHRIRTVTPLHEFFTFDAADTDARTFGLYWHEPKDVFIEVDADAADYVRDRTWSDDQHISDRADGSLLLRLRTTSEREVQAWVWSFGGLARVVDPARPAIMGE